MMMMMIMMMILLTMMMLLLMIFYHPRRHGKAMKRGWIGEVLLLHCTARLMQENGDYHSPSCGNVRPVSPHGQLKLQSA